MEVLRLFHHLNLQGKLTAYSFYRSLEYMTDSTGLNRPPVRIMYIGYSNLVSNTPLLIGSSTRFCIDGSGMAKSEDVETRRPSIRP